MATQYCLKCGNLLTQIMLDGQIREMCLQCGWVYYPQWKVSSGCLVEKNNALLLLKRATEPWLGCWYLPAGYVEIDETPMQAAFRETKEETGLTVNVQSLFGVYPFDDDPRGKGILILYRAEVTGGRFTSNPEISEIGYFSPSAIPEPLTGAGHSAAINDWIMNSHE
jgi:ADP-ribose pyrophosphatase YjhB (NUDIX family)